MGWLVGLLVFFGFLYFLFKLPKQTLGCLGVLVGLAALLGYVLIFRPEQERKRAQDEIVITVSYAPERCPRKDYPLLVTIQNWSNKTVTEVSWRVDAYKPGYNSNLAGYINNYSTGKTLHPGEGWSACYNLPLTLERKGIDVNTLEYRISSKYATFE
jgi:hypothetical protein